MSLDNHTKHIHGVVKRRFKCDLCEKDFGHRQSLKIHVTSFHENIKAFECRLCSKKFEGKTGLTNHMNFIHEKERKF
jgi:ribosomal protein L37AE/L43A